MKGIGIGKCLSEERQQLGKGLFDEGHQCAWLRDISQSVQKDLKDQYWSLFIQCMCGCG